MANDEVIKAMKASLDELQKTIAEIDTILNGHVISRIQMIINEIRQELQTLEARETEH